MCNEKQLKTKTKSYKGKISTDYHDDVIPKKKDFCFICLSVIFIDSAFEIGQNYYRKVF